jgi:Protein of unknown function (DUF2442)
MPDWIEKQLNKRYTVASARGRAKRERGPRAISAGYERGRIVVALRSGVELRFAPELAQGLRGATPADLKQVLVTEGGLGLHWPRLDADLYVPNLAAGIFGSHTWMQEIGGRGGAATSEAKIAAARANGKKGGRPVKLAA